jgi:hypothetical protein
MKKIQVLTLSLIVVSAFSAVTTSAASAVNRFLLNGGEITATTPVSVTGELLMEDMNATGKPDILCSLTFDGTISAGGKTGSITSMLTLAGELLEATGGSDLIECEAHSTCTNPVDIVANDLPWVLVADFSDPEKREGNEPSLTVDCNTIIGLLEDTCTGPMGAILTNQTGGILAEFLETNETITPPLSCTVGGAKQDLIVGDMEITSSSGTLSLSE